MLSATVCLGTKWVISFLAILFLIFLNDFVYLKFLLLRMNLFTFTYCEKCFFCSFFSKNSCKNLNQFLCIAFWDTWILIYYQEKTRSNWAFLQSLDLFHFYFVQRTILRRFGQKLIPTEIVRWQCHHSVNVMSLTFYEIWANFYVKFLSYFYFKIRKQKTSRTKLAICKIWKSFAFD